MEHIIQFGVTVDDKRIENEIIKQATDSLMLNIKDMGKKDWTTNESKLTQIARDIISEYVEKHKDEIIHAAIDKLMINLTKTKKVKDSIEEVL